MESDDESPFYPGVDPGEFRYTVAKFVKLLIRARWKADSGFLSRDDLERWGLSNIEEEPRTTAQLLGEAAEVLGDLNKNFIRRCGSGGIKESDESTPAGRLVDSVSGLVADCVSGPSHNIALVKAAQRLSDGKNIDWQTLVEWDMLRQIRDDLDQLPDLRSRPHSESMADFKNVFRRSGDDWEIRYAGGSKNLYSNLDGLFYIHQLISCPNQGLLPSELRAAHAQFAAPQSTRVALRGNSTGDSEFQAEKDYRDAASDIGPVLDKQAKEELGERLAEIKKEIENCRKRNDDVGESELEKEKEFIVQQLKSSTGLGGGDVMISPAGKKARDAVRNAMKRAVSKISEKDIDCAAHLRNSLRYEEVIKYQPEQSVDWEL